MGLPSLDGTVTAHGLSQTVMVWAPEACQVSFFFIFRLMHTKSKTFFTFFSNVFFQRVFTEDYIYGWSPIVILILILSGFQLLMLGVIGEYIWRTLSQTRNRLKYVIDEIIEEK